MMFLACLIGTREHVRVRMIQHALLAERRRTQTGDTGRAVVARRAQFFTPQFATTCAPRELWVERCLFFQDATWHVGTGSKLLPVWVVEEAVHFFGLLIL